MQRVIRRAGRASIGELVAWDVGLLILAALLLVGEQALSKGPAAPLEVSGPPPTSPPPATPARPSPTRQPSPSATPRRRRTGPTRFARETPAPSRSSVVQTSPVRALEDQVRRLLVEGDPDAALALLLDPDPAVIARPEWTATLDRLVASLRVGDAWVAEQAGLEAAADRGDLPGAQAIVDALPSAVARAPLDAELDLAKARAGASDFEVTGFVPGEVRVEGSRALVSGPLDERQARTLLEVVEGVLAQATRLGVSGLPAPLEVRLQAPDAPKVSPGKQRVVTVVRGDDGLESLGTRLRWHTARWVADAAGELRPWLRAGLARLLAGAAGAGRPPAPAPNAKAWRRLFLTQPPLGDGIALQDMLATDAPDPVRAWALAWFAAHGADPNLPPLQDLLAGRARLQLDPSAAADLEAAWVAGLEAAW